jgi:hypothetical protein
MFSHNYKKEEEKMYSLWLLFTTYKDYVQSPSKGIILLLTMNNAFDTATLCFVYISRTINALPAPPQNKISYISFEHPFIHITHYKLQSKVSG